ncbi:hypothetical protein HK101_003512 [Irineochytrium annulatum]|nr:hypothetical protein HK101_003512 [Irineochytrium annulatum]
MVAARLLAILGFLVLVSVAAGTPSDPGAVAAPRRRATPAPTPAKPKPHPPKPKPTNKKPQPTAIVGTTKVLVLDLGLKAEFSCASNKTTTINKKTDTISYGKHKYNSCTKCPTGTTKGVYKNETLCGKECLWTPHLLSLAPLKPCVQCCNKAASKSCSTNNCPKPPKPPATTHRRRRDVAGDESDETDTTIDDEDVDGDGIVENIFDLDETSVWDWRGVGIDVLDTYLIDTNSPDAFLEFWFVTPESYALEDDVFDMDVTDACRCDGSDMDPTGSYYVDASCDLQCVSDDVIMMLFQDVSSTDNSTIYDIDVFVDLDDGDDVNSPDDDGTDASADDSDSSPAPNLGTLPSSRKTACDVSSFLGSDISIQSADPRNGGLYLQAHPDGRVTMEAEAPSPAQTFSLSASSLDDGGVTIESRAYAGLCLVDADDDAAVTLGDCDGVDDSYGYAERRRTTWEFDCEDVEGTAVLRSSAGRCLDDYGATEDGVVAVTWDCVEGLAHQVWNVYQVDGYY